LFELFLCDGCGLRAKKRVAKARSLCKEGRALEL